MGEEKAVRSVIHYLRANHNSSFLTELRRVGLSHRVLDEYDVAALMIHANIEISEWRKVVQALKIFMGVDKVCASESKWRVLGCGANDVYSDVYNYYKPQKSENALQQRPEKITYWWKDPEKDFVTHLCNIINGHEIDPTQIE